LNYPAKEIRRKTGPAERRERRKKKVREKGFS